MTLLFQDGFDAGDYAIKWYCDYTGGLAADATVTRFGSGRSLRASAANHHVDRAIPPASKVIVGAAMICNSNCAITLLGDAGSTAHCSVQFTPTTIAVKRGTTGTGTVVSANYTFLADAFYYVEVSATVADSGGRWVVRVNGEVIIDFTGDTRAGGTSPTIDLVQLWQASNVACWWDDVYICDGNGTTNNDFLGDVRVRTLPPTGPGATTQLTPSSGANWSCVDELPYSAADYVSGSVVGNKDTYVTSDIPAGYDVKGIQLNAVAKKTDAGPRTLKTVVRSGGVDYSGPGQALGSSDSLVTRTLEQDPATSAAWTASAVNAMEIGVEVA